MPQFRLTKKFSDDCKISSLSYPTIRINPLDDWCIDRVIVDRRKIAIVTHVKSAFTFFIPYAEAAGGAKNIISFFHVRLRDIFKINGMFSLADKVDELFSQETIFTKTVDRRVLGYMNDFKRCSKPYPKDPRPVNWNDAEWRINNMPLKGGPQDWMFAVERFNALTGANLPKRI